MLFVLGDMSLQWGLGAPLSCCWHTLRQYPFCSISQHHKGWAGAGPRRPQILRAHFSVWETFDANVKVPKAVFPRRQSTGPSDTYIVRLVWQCSPSCEEATQGPIAPHMGPPGQWLWVARRATPSWGNGIALKSPLVLFGTPKRTAKRARSTTRCSEGGRAGHTRTFFVRVFLLRDRQGRAGMGKRGVGVGGALRDPPAPRAPIGPGDAQKLLGQGGPRGREGAGAPTRGGSVVTGGTSPPLCVVG